MKTKLEKDGGSPLITRSLFKNKEYATLLIIGFTAYYYLTLMTNYGAYAVINIMGSSATQAEL